MSQLEELGLRKNLYKDPSYSEAGLSNQYLNQQVTNITNQVNTVPPGTVMQEAKFTGVCTMNSQNIPRIFWGASDALPAGWSITNPSTGNYTVTHNINSNLVPILTAKAVGTINVAVSALTSTTFSVVARDVTAAGALTNAAFYIAAFVQ